MGEMVYVKGGEKQRESVRVWKEGRHPSMQPHGRTHARTAEGCCGPLAGAKRAISRFLAITSSTSPFPYSSASRCRGGRRRFTPVMAPSGPRCAWIQVDGGADGQTSKSRSCARDRAPEPHHTNHTPQNQAKHPYTTTHRERVQPLVADGRLHRAARRLEHLLLQQAPPLLPQGLADLVPARRAHPPHRHNLPRQPRAQRMVHQHPPRLGQLRLCRLPHGAQFAGQPVQPRHLLLERLHLLHLQLRPPPRLLPDRGRERRQQLRADGLPPQAKRAGLGLARRLEVGPAHAVGRLLLPERLLQRRDLRVLRLDELRLPVYYGLGWVW